MEARFRIRTREGEELCPRTTEIFAEFVRSGVVRPEDLVYDALTGEWVPAALHPMVRLIKDPLTNGCGNVERDPLPSGPSAAGVEAAPGDAGSDASGDVAAHDADPLDTLELVEMPTVSPEEEAQAFIDRMEDERRLDPDRPELLREMSAKPLVFRAPETVAEWGHEAPPPVPVDRSGVEVPGTAQGAEGALRDSWVRPGLIGLAVTVSLGLLAIFASVAKPSYRVGDRMPELAEAGEPPARPLRRIPDTERAVRGAAVGTFANAIDRLRRPVDVGPVPSEWLSGRYLSNAAAYPQVRNYWQRYLGYVEQARADEENLYRRAYLQALDQAGVTGPVRSLRLATALEDFSARREARAQSYDRAWELAAAALALHDTLVGLRGRLSYEPAVGSRVSANPVIEAVGTDAEAQARLDSALDRVLNVLHDGERSVSMASIPGWLATSLRESTAQSVQKPEPPTPSR